MHWLSGTGHVLWCNQTELNVLGYTKEEYFGKPIMDFCPDEQELVLEIFKTLGSGNTIKDVPVRFRTKDGSIRELLIDSNVNWNADGSFRHTRCCIRDDTNRKVREERLRVTAQKEAQLAKVKAAFMRKLLHEIRTPSHVVCGMLASLEEDLRDPARSLSDKVMDASDVQLFQDGKVPKLRSAQFDLRAALVSLFKGVQRRCPDSPEVKRQLHVDRVIVSWFDLISDPSRWPDRMPKMLEGDEQKMIRVLSRLIDNAIAACTEGEVRLEVQTWPASHGLPHRLTFNVVDTGPGIPEGEDVHCYFHVGARAPRVLARPGECRRAHPRLGGDGNGPLHRVPYG